MLTVVALLVGVAVPPAPPPRPAALEITWTAPQECPDEDVLRKRVLSVAQLDEAGEGTLFVDGIIEPSEGAFELRLRTSLGELADERSIRDSDCDALVQAAALFVAVSVDPYSEPPAEDDVPSEPKTTAAMEPPAPSSDPVPADDTVSPAPVNVVATPPRRGGAWRPDAVFVGLAPQVELGALPGLSGGPRLSLGVQWRRASLGVYGLYGAPRRTDVILGASGLAQLGAAGVVGCGNPVSGELRLPLCGVVEAGGIRVASRGLDPANQLLFPWTAVGARAGLERRWGRVGVFSSAEALVPVVRTDVRLGDDSSFSTWAVSLRAVVGLKIFFATESA